MRPFTLLIERTRIERASVTVLAGSRDEAERLGHEQAASDECLWEESEREIRVGTEEKS